MSKDVIPLARSLASLRVASYSFFTALRDINEELRGIENEEAKEIGQLIDRALRAFVLVSPMANRLYLEASDKLDELMEGDA
jgi:ribonuclease PH